MISKRSLYSLLGAAMLSSALFFTACDDTTSPVTETAPSAPSGLMAVSINETTVGIKWTASSSSNVKDYVITATPTGGTVLTFDPIGKDTVQATISGLTAGTEYTFAVLARSATLSSSSINMKWSPAKRWVDVGGAPIRLYETASSFASGLAITATGPETRTLAQGATWDLCLDTRDNSYDIGSPNLSSYTITGPKTTFIAFDTTRYRDVTGLSAVYESANLAPAGAKLINFNNVTKNFMFAFKTASNNYGRVLVKATGGNILQGTSPNRYVELEISYNPTMDQPYGLASGGGNNGVSASGKQ